METVKVGYETRLNEYVKQERTAVQLINSIGELMFNKELVSNDIIGNVCASIFDSTATFLRKWKKLRTLLLV